VLVDTEHGNGMEASTKIDKIIDYVGKEIKIASQISYFLTQNTSMLKIGRILSITFCFIATLSVSKFWPNGWFDAQTD
jgi:hypothetical protein